MSQKKIDDIIRALEFINPRRISAINEDEMLYEALLTATIILNTEKAYLEHELKALNASEAK